MTHGPSTAQTISKTVEWWLCRWFESLLWLMGRSVWMWIYRTYTAGTTMRTPELSKPSKLGIRLIKCLFVDQWEKDALSSWNSSTDGRWTVDFSWELPDIFSPNCCSNSDFSQQRKYIYEGLNSSGSKFGWQDKLNNSPRGSASSLNYMSSTPRRRWGLTEAGPSSSTPWLGLFLGWGYQSDVELHPTLPPCMSRGIRAESK